jgi:hypothetical protein
VNELIAALARLAFLSQNAVTGDQDASEVCREIITECRPRFLCILGGRYGWVPPGKSRSITADEVHYGVIDRALSERGFAYFYFRNDAATSAMVETIPGEFREPQGSDNYNKLVELKRAIVTAGLNPFTYPAQWDNESRRLIDLGEFGRRVYDDLLASMVADPELQARFATDAATELDEFAEENAAMDAFIEERTERFVIGSREPLMRDMLAFAAVDPAVGGPNTFVLTGDPGSGKPAFLAKFTRELAALHPFSFILPTFIGASASSTDLRRTLRRLCHELALAAGSTEPLPLDIKDLITHFQKLLAEAAGRRRVVLVFDALNRFDTTDGAHWLNWLPRELPPGVRIVASVIAPADGQPEHQALAILRTRPGTRIVKLEPLTKADTHALIEGCSGVTRNASARSNSPRSSPSPRAASRSTSSPRWRNCARSAPTRRSPTASANCRATPARCSAGFSPNASPATPAFETARGDPAAQRLWKSSPPASALAATAFPLLNSPPCSTPAIRWAMLPRSSASCAPTSCAVANCWTSTTANSARPP